MFKEIISSKRYWTSVCFFGLGSILVFSVVEHIMQYGGFTIGTFLEDKIQNGRWVRYLISRLVGGLLYGGIMMYYFESRKRKSNQ